MVHIHLFFFALFDLKSALCIHQRTVVIDLKIHYLGFTEADNLSQNLSLNRTPNQLLNEIIVHNIMVALSALMANSLACPYHGT